MGFTIKYISSSDRYKWIKNHFNLKETIFMGDGLFDLYLIKNSYLSICPKNSVNVIKKYASHVTKTKGGERAVAEACIYILKKVFKKNIEKLIL